MIVTHVHKFTNIDNLVNFIQKENYIFNDPSKLLIQVFFISTDEMYISSILETLNKYFPKAHIIGTTTDGSICSDGDSQITTISFSQFEKSTLKHTLTPFELSKEDEAAREIWHNILNEKSKVLILFVDGLLCNTQKLTQEINKQFPQLTIVGGMAGDNAKFEKTYVCDNSGYATQAIAALSIESDSLHIYNDFHLAWRALGKELEVTKADGNIIYEIDGENAVKVFDKYIKTRYLRHYNDKSRPTISIEFPFILKKGDTDITRPVFRCYQDGSLQCTAEVQIGDKLRFSYTNSEEIIRSGFELSCRIKQQPVETIFIYSCMARRRFMGENIRYDIEPLIKIAPICGFYSYGEIFTTSTRVEVTGHTMTILALSEDKNVYSNNIDRVKTT